MSTPTGQTTPRSLSSEDGQTWQHESPGAGPVTTIVIGTLDQDKTVTLSDDLHAGLESHLATVTHLHLWHIENRTALPELPPGLECLDVRGCARLESLPELAPELETLDLGGCAGLKALPAIQPPETQHPETPKPPDFRGFEWRTRQDSNL